MLKQVSYSRILCGGLLFALNAPGLIFNVQARDTRPPSEYKVTIETERPEAFYHQGETVGFNVSLTCQEKPVSNAVVQLRISKDGLAPNLQEADLKITDGKAVASGVMNEPGFLNGRVDFRVPGENRILTAYAGAAVDPLEINASLPPPDDFDAFWAEQRQKLSAAPMNLKLTPVKSNYPGIECYDVQADCSDGIHLSAYLAFPSGAAKGSLPATVLTHGAGVASSRLSIAAAWAKDGFVAIDFSAHGLPNGQPQSFYSALYQTELKQYYMKDPSSRDTIFFRELFIRLMRAIDVVTARPEWDGKILVANGRSQGGGQSIAAGGLDPRVTFIAAQIPAMCDHTGVAAGRINGWPKLVPLDDAGKPDPVALQSVRYYDAMNFASRTKADAFFTVGFIDRSCPPTSVYATYNRISGKKEIMNHLHTGHVTSTEADDAVRAAVLNHVQELKAKQQSR